jgi:hypothetical protein
MNAGKLISRLLIGFVLLSFALVAFRSLRAVRDWRPPSSVQAATPVTTAPPSERPAEQGSKVIAYYFHVTVRCTTCRSIESYSKEVIHARFAKELAAGRLEWRLVNVQLPGNRHFVQDYELFTKSLVLVRTQNGQQKEFRVLNDTWELVGDKSAMQTYVEKEVRGFLRKLG